MLMSGACIKKFSHNLRVLRSEIRRTVDNSPSDFDRVPPQALEAEQSVLGSMLLSKDAIGEIGEIISGIDFYRPQNETIYNTILDLYSRGEPADPITVAAELERAGALKRIGGGAYLHSLTASVPTPANATH